MTATSSPSVLQDERGVVFVEFLVAFIPVWTFALCAFQLSLLAAANLIVKHAADSAARSASVVLTDDPADYGGEPERSVEQRPSSQGTAGRSRLDTIRLAARIPLMPWGAHRMGVDLGPTLAGVLPSIRNIVAALLGRPSEVTVEFPDAAGERVSGREVTVRVTFAYECMVPIARRLLCEPRGRAKLGRGLNQPALGPLQAHRPNRVRLFAHQATLLIQDAPYAYQPRGS